MDYKGISPSELADSIGVQRSNVTHVLKGRNKPSFQFIEKMLQIYPDLNAKWLLLGTGNMIDNPQKSRTLFDELPEPSTSPASVTTQAPILEEKKSVLTDIQSGSFVDPAIPEPKKKLQENVVQDQFFIEEKPIERLLIIYKDQTFKVYYPSQ